MFKIFLRFRDLFPSRPFIPYKLIQLLRLILVWISFRTKAPLRLIVARTIQVHEFRRFGGKPLAVPRLFTLVDTLECGHEYPCHGLDLSDLINGYTEHPSIRARRHRCVPCAELLAQKKPAASVHPSITWGKKAVRGVA